MATKKAAAKKTARKRRAGRKGPLADPPITIKGGSMVLDCFVELLHTAGTTEYTHPQGGKKIKKVSIVDDNTNQEVLVYNPPANGRFTITMDYKV